MLQAIHDRRSIRQFQERDIPRETVEKIIQAGMLAPSAKNRQPWRFVIAQGASKRSMLASMARGLKREQVSPLLPARAAMLQGAVRTLRVMEQAPVVIFILERHGTTLHASPDVETRVYERCDMQSIGACLENIALTATTLGLSSLWIGDIYFAYDELRSWLRRDEELAAALALGYADEQPPARPRLPINAMVEWRS